MKKIAVLLLLIISVVVSNAQNAEKIATKSHEFGFHAGFSTGVGLSYRYWPDKLGIQITALPIKSDDVTFVSVGVTGLYSIYHSQHVRFFMYLGGAYHVNHYDEETAYVDPYSGYYRYEDVRVKKDQMNIGFGPGFGFGNRVRFNLMAGYGFYDITGKFNMLPTAEGGLYFRF